MWLPIFENFVRIGATVFPFGSTPFPPFPPTSYSPTDICQNN